MVWMRFLLFILNAIAQHLRKQIALYIVTGNYLQGIFLLDTSLIFLVGAIAYQGNRLFFHAFSIMNIIPCQGSIVIGNFFSCN